MIQNHWTQAHAATTIQTQWRFREERRKRAKWALSAAHTQSHTQVRDSLEDSDDDSKEDDEEDDEQDAKEWAALVTNTLKSFTPCSSCALHIRYFIISSYPPAPRTTRHIFAGAATKEASEKSQLCFCCCGEQTRTQAHKFYRSLARTYMHYLNAYR